MMNYKKYNRSFVMLEEQSRDFCTGEGPVKGYLKVETGNNKGALRCVVQNLKYFSQGDYIYKLILFGKKGDKTIHTLLGGLIINRNGNGETYFRFDPLNVDGKGNHYDHFSVAIVAAASEKNNKEALHPVLKGIIHNENTYYHTEDNDINNTNDINERDEELKEYREAEEKQMERMKQLEQMQQEEPIQQYNQQCKQQEPIEQYEQKYNQNNTTQKYEPKYNQNEYCKQIEQKEQMQQAQQIKKECLEKKKEVPKRTVYNSYYNEYLLQFCEYTCKVADYYEEVMPFEKDRTGAIWKKIEDTRSLPLVSPGAGYFSGMYKHYLFGAKPSLDGTAEEFYFAIPGRFTQEEQPDGGRSGFVFWQPMVGATQNEYAYGYWIVAVDAETGCILEVYL